MAYRLCLAGIGGPYSLHPDYLMRVLTEEQFRGWELYYDTEPWGEERADWRQMVNEARWAAILGGSETTQRPKPTWPYFDELLIDGERVAIEAARFAEDTEPTPEGGRRWKPGKGPNASLK